MEWWCPLLPVVDSIKEEIMSVIIAGWALVGFTTRSSNGDLPTLIIDIHHSRSSQVELPQLWLDSEQTFRNGSLVLSHSWDGSAPPPEPIHLWRLCSTQWRGEARQRTLDLSTWKDCAHQFYHFLTYSHWKRWNNAADLLCAWRRRCRLLRTVDWPRIRPIVHFFVIYLTTPTPPTSRKETKKIDSRFLLWNLIVFNGIV